MHDLAREVSCTTLLHSATSSPNPRPNLTPLADAIANANCTPARQGQSDQSGPTLQPAMTFWRSLLLVILVIALNQEPPNSKTVPDARPVSFVGCTVSPTHAMMLEQIPESRYICSEFLQMLFPSAVHCPQSF